MAIQDGPLDGSLLKISGEKDAEFLQKPFENERHGTGRDAIIGLHVR